MALFGKGNTFGTGRPPGSRNKATALLDEIGREGVEDVIRKITEAAKEGDVRAASLLLARLWPRGRGRPVVLDLPPIETAADIIRANAAVIAQMAEGEITPEEAAKVVHVLELQRRVLETYEIEKGIQALETERTGLHLLPMAA